MFEELNKFDARYTEHYAYCPNCGKSIQVNSNDNTEVGHRARQGLRCSCIYLCLTN